MCTIRTDHLFDPESGSSIRPPCPFGPGEAFPEAADRADRLRLWEVPGFLKCPIIGLCATVGEQRRLLKKSGVCAKGKTPFEMHEVLVGSSDDENRLSRRLDHLLGRKFAKKTEALRMLPEATFMRQWVAAFSSGEYADIFWAAAVRADLTIKCKREIFGMVHMSMHAAADQQNELKSKLGRSEKQVENHLQTIRTLKLKRKDLARENQGLKREITSLQAGLAARTTENSELKERIAILEDQRRADTLEAENRRLRSETVLLENRAAHLSEKVSELQEQSRNLKEELACVEAVNAELADQAAKAMRLLMSRARCDERCPSFDLCKKRVLIVGGISRMETHYRELIEKRGGVLEYHDGYVKGGAKKLETRLKRADIILCPVNCNSHAACSLVKNLGKKHNKSVHMIPNFSLTAITEMLGRDDVEQGVCNGGNRPSTEDLKPFHC